MTGDKQATTHDDIVKNSKLNEQQAGDLARQIQDDMKSAVCGTPESMAKANQDLQNISKTLNSQNDNGYSAMLVNEQLQRQGTLPGLQIVDYGKPGQTDVHIRESFPNAEGTTVYSWDQNNAHEITQIAAGVGDQKAHVK
jgi:hypothetical protein